jgi:hypothetical protein
LNDEIIQFGGVWLENVKKMQSMRDSVQTETIAACDREAGIHDFLELAHNLNSSVLVTLDTTET